MNNLPVAEDLFDVDRQAEGRTDIYYDANCPFSHSFRKRLKYLIDLYNWLMEILKIYAYPNKQTYCLLFWKTRSPICTIRLH
jgi:hypothetical protein